MIKNELNSSYFKWMCRLVSNKRFKSISYQELLSYLDRIEFRYIVPMDVNRVSDGINLRYRFEYESGEPAESVSITFFGNRSCSVLEMMVALALRCEENIMNDPNMGDRTGQWFWAMVDNLGLIDMRDENFDAYYVDFVLSRFMNREYGKDGRGGLFVVDNCSQDLRAAEIWYQLNWYLESLYN